MRKQILSLLAALALCLTLLPVNALAEELEPEEETELETVEEVIPGEDIEIPYPYDNDELFAAYVQKTLYPEYAVSTLGTAAGDRLGGANKEIYDQLKTEIEKVASGEKASTEFNIDLTKVSVTTDGSKLTNVDTRTILSALLADCPYELYWYDKTQGMKTSYSYSGNAVKELKFQFTVSSNYYGGPYKTNLTQTSAPTNTKTEAQKVVNDHAGLSDYEKLVAYKEYICEKVTYNYAAANNQAQDEGQNPWQLIWVFDGNPATNVVCEGYSKAFQYLCDLSTFTDVKCYTVTGGIPGAHMWNIVTIGGKNYLVDVTNCDGFTDNGTSYSYSSGFPDRLFLVGGTSTDNVTYTVQIPAIDYQYKDGNQTKTVTLKASTMTYTYDSDAGSVYGEDVLKLTNDPKYLPPVTSLTENGVVAPVKGATPVTKDNVTVTATVPGKTAEQTVTVNSVSWNPTDNPFAAGKEYTVTIGLTAPKGYQFTSATTVPTGYTLSVGNPATAATLTKKFPATAAAALTGIAITNGPTKTDYIVGQSFDEAGMVVTATYEDGSTAVITDYTVTDGTNLTAGKTTVTIEYGGKTATQAITVTAKAITEIEVSGDYKTAYKIGDTADWTGMVVTAKYNDGTTKALSTNEYTVTGFNSTAYAASQTITVTETVTSGTGKTATFTISIAKIAKKTLTVNDFDYTAPTNLKYDGSAKTQSVTFKSGVTDAGSITVTYKQGKTAVTSPTNAGTYDVYVTATGGTKYDALTTAIKVGSFTIAKATPTITANDMTITMGQSGVSLDAAVDPTSLTLRYSSGDTGVVTVDASGNLTPVKTGTATITISTAGNNNYASATKDVTVTVNNKASVTVTFANATSKPYKDEGYKIGEQFTAATVAGGKTITGYRYGNKTGTTLANLTDVVKDVGTYTVTAYYDSATEYGETAATFTITKANQTALTINSGTTVTYGETLALTTTGGNGDGAVTYTVTNGTGAATVSGSTLTPTKAGTVKVKATKAGDTHYNSVDSAEVTITINKAEWPIVSKTANGSAKYGTSGSVDLSAYLAPGGLFGTVTAEDTNHVLDGTPAMSGSSLTFKFKDGESLTGKRAKVTVAVTGATNYTGYDITVDLTVSNKESQATLTINSGTTVTYGQTLTLTTTGGDGTGAVTYTVTNGTGAATVSGSTLTPAKAGTVVVKATKAGDDTYDSADSAPVTITIAKATPTGTPSFTKITTRGKTLADAALTVGTITPAGTIAWDLGGSQAVTANTAYAWTFTPTDTTNYTTLTGSVTPYKVTSSTPTVTPTQPGNDYYDDDDDDDSSSGGGTTTSTTTNSDGSKTTTTTNKTTGTVTETTKEKDGTTTTVETKKDGTVTETVKTPSGVTGTVVTDKSGDVTSVKASVTSDAVKEAGEKNEAVTLPVEVPVERNTSNAPEIRVSIPRNSGTVKVEIPVKAVTPGTVAVIVAADGTEKIVATSVVTAGGVALKIEGSATVKVIDNAKSFEDVPNDNVFFNEIASMSARNVMVGKTTERFDLYSGVTLNQIANVAGRMTGEVDVKDYAGGISWASGKGLSVGDVKATRGDVLKALYAAAGSPKVSPEETVILIKYQDGSEVPEELLIITTWAVQKGIMKGTTDGRLNLAAGVTRGQACAMAGRALSVIA